MPLLPPLTLPLPLPVRGTGTGRSNTIYGQQRNVFTYFCIICIQILDLYLYMHVDSDLRSSHNGLYQLCVFVFYLCFTQVLMLSSWVFWLKFGQPLGWSKRCMDRDRNVLPMQNQMIGSRKQWHLKDFERR